MFHDDNGFRDMFIYGSMAMLAALAMPSKKAHAAEFYLCGDGRVLELTNSNRQQALGGDACVTSWYSERLKTISKKSGKAVETAKAHIGPASRSAGYQIQTSAIEALTNAIEVPEGKAIILNPAVEKPAIKRESVALKKRKNGRDRNLKIAQVSRRSAALRDMGDGILAQ